MKSILCPFCNIKLLPYHEGPSFQDFRCLTLHHNLYILYDNDYLSQIDITIFSYEPSKTFLFDFNKKTISIWKSEDLLTPTIQFPLFPFSLQDLPAAIERINNLSLFL